MAARAALIALDWGSSALRAYRLGETGEVLETRSSDGGASRLGVGLGATERAGVFERHLRGLVGDWLADGTAVLACGMVGSAHGWEEATYLDCPLDLAALGERLVPVVGGPGLDMRIVPGVAIRPRDAAPDVMRGEETQVAGVLAAMPASTIGRACVVLPGTHSKWVALDDGRIASFATRMTGELFELLRSHSVLARSLLPTDGFDADAFTRGCLVAIDAGGADLSRILFGVRTLGLFDRLAASSLPDYLSGLLVGAEVVAGLANLAADVPIVLAGERVLCERYALALSLLERPCAATVAGAAAAGLWRIAAPALRSGRWVTPAPPRPAARSG